MLKCVCFLVFYVSLVLGLLISYGGVALPSSSAFWSAVGAIGTIGAVVVALFHEQLDRQINGPRLSLEVTEGGLATSGLYFRHLKVNNAGGMAREVAVFCTGMEFQQPDGTFKKFSFPRVRLQWPFETIAGANIGPTRNLYDADHCDLCSIDASDNRLKLAFHAMPNAVRDRMIYHEDHRIKVVIYIQVVGSNFKPLGPRKFKITQNGKFIPSETMMKNRLSVDEILE